MVSAGLAFPCFHRRFTEWRYIPQNPHSPAQMSSSADITECSRVLDRWKMVGLVVWKGFWWGDPRVKQPPEADVSKSVFSGFRYSPTGVDPASCNKTPSKSTNESLKSPIHDLFFSRRLHPVNSSRFPPTRRIATGSAVGSGQPVKAPMFCRPTSVRLARATWRYQRPISQTCNTPDPHLSSAPCTAARSHFCGAWLSLSHSSVRA